MENGDPELTMTRPAARLPLFAVTVAVHVVLAWAFFTLGAPGRLPAGGMVERMTWVDLPAPMPEPAPAPPPEAEPQPPAPPKRALARLAPTRSAPLRAPAAAPREPDAEPVAPEAPASAAAPVFDREAALAAARKHANDPDPARAGTAVAQFDARRELKETEQEQLGRKIAGAKRGDCIGPNGGGSLLTPLFWLLDKKGGGCKF